MKKTPPLKVEDWPIPSPENMKRVGPTEVEKFIHNGLQLFYALDEEMRLATGADPRRLNVLDFGCGCGRVATPYIAANGRLTGVDIDASAIEFLKTHYPDHDFRTTQFEPPLPFDDSTFDAVYSISIWSHLNKDSGERWLREIYRILKPGGVFLMSIMSHTSLIFRHARPGAEWDDISNRDLRREGALFREYAFLQSHQDAYPGVTDSYGSTFYDDDYVRTNWSKVFSSVEVLPGRMAGQDLVILKK
ncbi:MAG: class I SAM-dependent methyltransferase [Pseudomonadota bacterium]